ncbi:poly-gamma-glutamate biosynthesis protein PgsC/CapC [Actinomadura sp. DC4]|uniref:poly-gamma-glutamate biosynthesis protein PgsC/CapC n=1 Tax=Actinomadura sp. DC4 TaxID=3055069 RepID=UPI0025B0311E|nr:poly-gamma-glutamate biosynthesis protein PgsC/CapC [Actinomadura sp. DC4]MDN3357194.1 poly-gamma-glutamate biosynthesis protein PgsC/CapC [Actinomadura sp. DC4]
MTLIPAVGIDVGPTLSVVILAMGLLGALICYLLTNLSPGGLIVPGWLALTVVEWPKTLIIGVLTTAVTYAVMKVLRRHAILYGKRLFAATVLVAVLIEVALFLTLRGRLPGFFPHNTLGLVVPGLIAYQIDKQRVLPTVVSLVSVAAATCVMLTLGVALS